MARRHPNLVFEQPVHKNSIADEGILIIKDEWKRRLPYECLTGSVTRFVNFHIISGCFSLAQNTDSLDFIVRGNIGHAGEEANIRREGGGCSATTNTGDTHTEHAEAQRSASKEGVICSSTPERAVLSMVEL